MDDAELFNWSELDLVELDDATRDAVAQPWDRWEDADTFTMDEAGYFRELGHRLMLDRSER